MRCISATAQRLFAHHVFAGLQCLDRELRVQVMRQQDRHALDSRVAQK
jgi:hypothetical protein